MNINEVTLLGFVGKDPEIKEVGGIKCSTFSLPTSKKFKDKNGETKDKTQWHNIVAWRGLADLVEKYVKKGSELYVKGEIEYRSWEDASGVKRYVTDVVATSIQLGRSPQAAEAPTPAPAPVQASRPVSTPLPTYDDASPSDDLPF